MDDLNLRQTCNVAYAAMTEAMGPEERASMDALLATPPGEDPAPPRAPSLATSTSTVPRAAPRKSRGVEQMIAQLQGLGR